MATLETQKAINVAEKAKRGLDEDEEETPTPACGILGRYPVVAVLGFAAIGIGMGVGLSFWEPEDPDTKSKLLKWLGLIGDLFIRALKCVVLPLVFINVVISIMEMMTVGKAGSIGWKTIGLYLATTVMASIIGIISIVSFKSLFEQGEFAESSPATVSLGCNEDGAFLAEMDNGTVVCTADYMSDDDVAFRIIDLSGNFMTKSSGPASGISLSDTVYDGVFTKLVSSNIFESFVSANFAAVVMFAIVFGIALSKVYDHKKHVSAAVMDLFKELDAVFLVLINWIIMITPFAVWSLIVKAVGSQSDLKEAFTNVGFLVVATIVAMLAHYLIVHWGLFALVTKQNPWFYMKHIIPAQTMAFACASSAATIPVTLRSVGNTGRVPEAIARFVVPLGATVNMDGGAIYFPCACIWLAVLNGIEPNAGNYILLVFISTIGSAGTAPVPSASLVLIITAYNTVFGTTGTPEGFSYILAIDWFMDRLRTTLNVTGDAVVSGMVAAITPIEESKAMAANMSDSEEVVSAEDAA
jgi:Na+/H+-dicarboxylate symporter